MEKSLDKYLLCKWKINCIIRRYTICPKLWAYSGVSGAGKILLEFTVSGSDVAEVGTVVFGTVNTLGSIDYGAKLGITDYSIKKQMIMEILHL